MSTLVSRRNAPKLRRPCKRQPLAWLLSVLTAFAVIGAATPADAAPMRGKRRVGLGGGLGDPMGPSLKLFLAPQHALQFDLGWAPMHHGNGIFHINYLFHIPPFVSNSILDFGLYLGAGLGVAFWASPRYDCGSPAAPRPCYWYGYHGRYNSAYGYHGRGGAGMIVRPPIGLYFHWQKVPLDTVIEGTWSPYVVLWDPYHGDFSVKVRYYF